MTDPKGNCQTSAVVFALTDVSHTFSRYQHCWQR